MANWQQRYKFIKGDWPHPDSPAGRCMSCHDYHSAERVLRTKNVIQALWFAKNSLSSAVKEETGEALDEVLSGILPAILMALAIVAGCTLVGLSLGALGGAIAGVGVGAVPGAIAGSSTGFSAGMWILEWMGLAFLAVHVGKNMYQVTRLVESGFNDAWGTGARDVFGLSSWDTMHYGHDKIPGHSQVMSASRKFARAVAVLIRLVLEGVVLYLTARGVAKLPELVAQLKNSRLSEGFAVWVEKNHQRLMNNPKLTQDVGGTTGKPVRVLTDHTNMKEQPRPGAKKTKITGSRQITKSELEKWYQKQNDVFKDPDYMASHARGTDFSKPVYQKTLPTGTEIIQYEGARGPGMYATYPNTLMENLAISGERTLVTYKTIAPLEVLESTAAEFPVGQVPNVGGVGGGQQLVLPSGWQNAVKIIP
ncbi:MAG: DUF6861 domain-containing protein [Geobacteraceae bacterium]